MFDNYGGPDRRRAPRVKAEFIAIYKVEAPVEIYMWIGNKEVNALMLDLSASGMAVSTDYDIPWETMLAVKFTLINLYAEKDERVRTIQLTGEVRYNILLNNNEYRLGIAFTQISEADKRAIANFVKSATI